MTANCKFLIGLMLVVFWTKTFPHEIAFPTPFEKYSYTETTSYTPPQQRVKTQTAASETFFQFVRDNSGEIAIPMTYLDSNKDTIVQMPFASRLEMQNSAEKPKAYYISAGLTGIIGLLDLHKIAYIKTIKPHTFSPDDSTVSLDQPSGVMLAIALEPASMRGLVHTSEYNLPCKAGNDYPIFRITEFKGSSDGR